MKRIAIFISLMLLCSGLHAQTGPWSGKLSINGASLTIVFNFDGEQCTMDSPDQGAKGIYAEKSVNSVGKIIIRIPSIGASFEGFRLMDSIIGEFTQGGLTLPLALEPGAPNQNRPQTPTGPFPYTSEEISFSNGDTVLKGTLTKPGNCGSNTPAVLLVTGSGIQNRDEEIYGHKPFAVIADALARSGIASLRYDDRGFGESTGDVVNCTIEDLMNDALSGVGLLRNMFDKVGVAGHSEGGSIAFMLAAGKKIDFVISLAGGIVPMKETLLKQNHDILLKNMFSEKDVNAYCEALSEAINAILDGEAPRNMDDTDLPKALKQNFLAASRQLMTPYMKSFLALDVQSMLGKVDCPVLAFNGTMDSQVNCNDNLGALRAGLKPENATIVEVKNVNHLFQHCKTGDVSEYSTIEETISPDVLDNIVSWVNHLQTDHTADSPE